MNPTLKIWLQLIGLLAIEVAVIVGIAAQAQRLTKQAAWRRTIWHACILALLMLVGFEFTGVARGIFAWNGRKEIAANPVLVRVAHDNVDRSTRLERLRLRSRADSQTASAANVMRQRELSAPGDLVARAASEILPKKWIDSPAVSESLSLIWLGAVWMVGATVVVGRLLVSRVILEVLRWKHGEIADADLKHAVTELAGKMGIRRRIRLMESAHICSPAAFGIIRPTIGLSVHFGEKFNSVQQGAMLAHELAHLAGNDPAWYLLADVLTALLWWHPLTWWARRQLQAQSEQAADDASLLVVDVPGVLAECLVALGGQLARTRSWMPLPLGVAGGGFRSGLGQRVERLVKLEGNAWRPPNRIRCGFVRVVGPVALVTTAILCTAWVVPPALNKGENMQTMKQTWRKSLAAFALLTALSPDGTRALAQAESRQSIAVNEGQPGEPVAIQVVPAAPNKSGGPRAYAVSGSAGSSEDLIDSVERLSRLTMSKEQQAIEAKLTDLRLGEVKYDGVPLVDVVNDLIKTAAKYFPDGLNFVLNRESADALGGPTAIDPATGLPVPQAAESPDLGSVSIKVDPALKNVRLIDLLDVITKTADRPIHYTIEDYGVLFSFGPRIKEQRYAMFQDRLSSIVKKMDAKPTASVLEVMTFKVDTNTFFDNMERTFGEKLLNHRPSQIRATLMDVFQKSFGIKFEGQDKAVFYNDANGVIMVRGASQDVAAMRGAIEMLGGVPYPAQAVQMQQRLQRLDSGPRANGSSGASSGQTTGGGGGGSGVPAEPQENR
jgi:beta-lactamase regulating signal transducer with metallopeptidase domain